MILRAGPYQFEFPGPALLMGVVNVTPDSFSDGGQFFKPQAAVERALQLVDQGAGIIDIGGESTRPGAEPVNEGEETRRVLPVIEQLAGRIKAPLSIDTQKAGVARAALAVGASMVNDIAAHRQDEALWQAVAEFKAGYVAMHMQGTPQTMQRKPTYGDVLAEIGAFFADRLDRLKKAGVEPEQVVLDVGIGFGKNLNHNLQLLAGLKRFTRFERPLLLGVSRKSFMGQLLGLDLSARLPASLACAVWAVQNGVQIVRTHDVAETCQALRMTEAIRAHQK